MRLKSFFNNSGMFDFFLLAPKSFLLILIGSIFTGILQSLSILAILPLMKYLGMAGNESSNLLFINYFEKMFSWLGLDNSLVSILIFLVLTTVSIAIIGFLINAYTEKISAKILIFNQRLMQNQRINSLKVLMSSQREVPKL